MKHLATHLLGECQEFQAENKREAAREQERKQKEEERKREAELERFQKQRDEEIAQARKMEEKRRVRAEMEKKPSAANALGFDVKGPSSRVPTSQRAPAMQPKPSNFTRNPAGSQR